MSPESQSTVETTAEAAGEATTRDSAAQLPGSETSAADDAERPNTSGRRRTTDRKRAPADGTLPSLRAPARRTSPHKRTNFDFWATRIGNGLLLASLVFAGFVAYAFAAPATYRSSALVWVEMPKGKLPLTLTEPLEAARRVHHAVLDSELINRLSFEFGPTTDAGRAETANRLRSAFEVHTIDGRAFSIAFRDSDRFRAQRVTSELAQRAAAALPQIVAPLESPDQAQENARQKHVEKLMNFIAAHPNVVAASEPAPQAAAESEKKPQTPSWQATAARDPAIGALYKERSRVQERLQELEKSQSTLLPTDNPYQDDDIWSNERKLRRRLSEIERSLEARRNALARSANAPAPKTAKPAVPEALRAEWQRLLEAVKEPPPVSTPKAHPLTAKIIKPADLARWPIDPNRKLLLWVGALAGLLCGAVIAFRPRPKPERPRQRSASRVWPMPSPALQRPLPPIARSLPLALGSARRGSLLPPAPGASARSIAVRGADADHPRGGFGRKPAAHLGLVRDEEAVAETLPAAPHEPRSADELRKSRPRHTLMFGSLEGELDRGGAPRGDRAMAITLRFPEPGSEEANARASARLLPPNPRSLPVVAHEFPGYRVPPSLDAAPRRALASELATASGEACLVLGVVGSPQGAKSQIAAELALALAELGRGRVLLLEGDFSRPHLHRVLGVRMPRSFGYSRQLEAFSQQRLGEGWSVVRLKDDLDVLAEGIMRTPGMVFGERVAESVARFADDYAFIVIDGPALTDTADCRALDRMIAGTVFVHSRDRAAELSRAAALFQKKRFSWTIAVD